MIISDSSDELAKLLYEKYIQAKDMPRSDSPFLAAIDGPCASGKTLLSRDILNQLISRYGLNVGLIEIDHFFLPPGLRSETRFAEPGGNIHYERFQQEVIEPILAHQAPKYSVFDCSIMDYSGTIEVLVSDMILIEGVYSHHPLWRDELDLRIFCHANMDVRLQRLEKRDGQQKLRRFIDEWIPMEDKYFEAFDVKNKSDIIFQSGFSQLS